MISSKTWRTALCVCALALVACGGEDGENGTEGVGGLDGIDGSTGERGADGTNGSNGTNGTNGINGTNGSDGIDGDDGDAGADGIDGEDGQDGAMGAMGLPGASGIIDRTKLTGDFVSYDCVEQNNSGISGSLRLAKFMDGSTLVTVKLDPANLGEGLRMSHIHANSVVEGGAPIITLNVVDELTGMSETLVSARNDGTPITYDELLNLDAFFNVHAMLPATSSACAGDIGGNELTGASASYDLYEVGSSGISAVATLQERKNGTTLVTVTATGDLGGINRAMHFHMGTVAVPVMGMGPLLTLTDIDATTQVSRTNVTNYDASSPINPGAAITYTQMLALDAFLNVHPNDTGGAHVAAGDVGINELTGDAISYDLPEANASGISGSVRLQERADGTTLVTLEVNGDLMGTDRAAHFHPGTVASPGTGALIDLTDVGATTNRSYTEVDAFNAGSPVSPGAAVTYDGLLALDAYVNVHLTADGGSSICAGDVGDNAP